MMEKKIYIVYTLFVLYLEQILNYEQHWPNEE